MTVRSFTKPSRSPEQEVAFIGDLCVLIEDEHVLFMCEHTMPSPLTSRQSSSPRFARGSIRAELVALALLLPLAIVLGTILRRPLPAAAPSISPPSPLITAATVSPSSSPAPSATPGQPVTSATAPHKEAVALEIHGPESTRTLSVPINRETTVAEVLTIAEREQGLTIQTKDYGGSLGVFIKAIDGVANDSARNLYWHLSVNGALSPVGASSARVGPGGVVRWSYEPMHEEE